MINIIDFKSNFKKINRNVGFISFNINNVSYNKLIKIGIYSKNYKLKKEFENYNKLIDYNPYLNIEKLTNIQIFNNIILNSYINVKVYYLQHHYIEIPIFFNKKFINEFEELAIDITDTFELIFLVGEYKINHSNLHDVFYKLDDNYLKFNITYNILNNYDFINKNYNFYHCDFKLANVTILNNIPNIKNDNDIKIFLLDFEFSLFIDNNDLILVTPELLLNNYLLLYKPTKINTLYLYLFDIYVFSLSQYYCLYNKNNYDYLNIIKIKINELNNIKKLNRGINNLSIKILYIFLYYMIQINIKIDANNFNLLCSFININKFYKLLINDSNFWHKTQYYDILNLIKNNLLLINKINKIEK